MLSMWIATIWKTSDAPGLNTCMWHKMGGLAGAPVMEEPGDARLDY